MCFSRSLPSKAPQPASLRPARLSGGMMFTIMGRGSPISPNTPGTAATSPCYLCATFGKRWDWKQHKLHVQGDMGRGRVVPQMSVRRNFTLAGRLSKSRNITLCLFGSLFMFLLWSNYILTPALSIRHVFRSVEIYTVRAIWGLQGLGGLV